MKILSIFKHTKMNNEANSQRDSNIISPQSRISFGMSASLIGKHFENIGLVIGQPKLLNSKTKEIVPCDIIHSSTKNGGTIHLIKENNYLLGKVQKMFKNNPEILNEIVARAGCVITPFIEKIIKQNKRLETILKHSIISEISYMKLSSKDDLKRVAKLGYKKNEEGKDIIFLQNFILNKAEYEKATRTVAIPLLKGLMQKGVSNILIRASAFGENPKSPIHLYETLGFKPLNATEDEIEKHIIQTAKGQRLDPNYRVMMYLPQDAILYSLLKKAPALEIEGINTDWLKL